MDRQTDELTNRRADQAKSKVTCSRRKNGIAMAILMVLPTDSKMQFKPSIKPQFYYTSG